MKEDYIAAMEARRDELLDAQGYITAKDFIDVWQAHHWSRPSVYDFFDRWAAGGVVVRIPKFAYIRRA